jgi:hypothetical protein
VTELEERLSRELKELSERAQPGSIRPLREPRGRKRPRAVRWLAPAAAVAGVLAVIAGVSLIGRQAGEGVPPVVPAEQGPMPRYYVTVWQTYAGTGNGQVIPTYAVVHDSATGAALATVRVPTLVSAGGRNSSSGVLAPSITAAGDDRTFVIMEQSDTPRVYVFYQLRVAANGRSAKLSKLAVSVPAYLALTDVALSPDGTRLAMDAQHCNAKTESCPYTGIRVVTIATGAAGTWTTRANGAPFNVSWVGNERVAFEWQAGVSNPPPGEQTGYRLLTLTGPSRDLMASRPVGSPTPAPDGSVPAELVTADGKAVLTSTGSSVVELSARTGQLLRVLYTATGGGSGCGVLSLAPAGIHVLVSCSAFGRVDGDRFTRLPGFPSPSSSGIGGQQAAAW